jgi:hypothetical protein
VAVIESWDDFEFRILGWEPRESEDGSMIWSEEEEFLSSPPKEFLGMVDVEAPYIIFGSVDEYREMVKELAREEAVSEGLISN